MAHGDVIWSELNTRDPKDVMAFNSATLGWAFKKVPMLDGASHLVRMGGGVVGWVAPKEH